MNSRPRDPDDLEGVERELQRYAGLTSREAPPDLTERVMNAVATEPVPRRGLLAWLGAPFASGGGLPRMLLVGATMALAVLAVVVAGQLGELFRGDQVGPSPAPSVIEAESVSPSPTLEPSPSPTATPSVTPSASPTTVPSAETSASPDDGSSPPATPRPTGSPDDDDDESPNPSDDETPEPVDEDNSGPGSEDD